MGMCKGCKQIFKTEDMVYNFCVDCQKTESYTKELELINNGTRQKERTLVSRQNWIIILSISLPLTIFFIVADMLPFLKISIPFVVFSLFFIAKATYLANKEK